MRKAIMRKVFDPDAQELLEEACEEYMAADVKARKAAKQFRQAEIKKKETLRLISNLADKPNQGDGKCTNPSRLSEEPSATPSSTTLRSTTERSS